MSRQNFSYLQFYTNSVASLCRKGHKRVKGDPLEGSKVKELNLTLALVSNDATVRAASLGSGIVPKVGSGFIVGLAALWVENAATV